MEIGHKRMGGAILDRGVVVNIDLEVVGICSLVGEVAHVLI